MRIVQMLFSRPLTYSVNSSENPPARSSIFKSSIGTLLSAGEKNLILSLFILSNILESTHFYEHISNNGY